MAQRIVGDNMIGFFLFFGWDEDTIEMVDLEPEDFDLDIDGPCTLIVDYSYFHLFFIFGVVTGRHYLLVNRYDEAIELDPKDVAEILEEIDDYDDISFLTRYGLGLFVLAIVLFSVLPAVIR